MAIIYIYPVNTLDTRYIHLISWSWSTSLLFMVFIRSACHRSLFTSWLSSKLNSNQKMTVWKRNGDEDQKFSHNISFIYWNNTQTYLPRCLIGIRSSNTKANRIFAANVCCYSKISNFLFETTSSWFYQDLTVRKLFLKLSKTVISW